MNQPRLVHLSYTSSPSVAASTVDQVVANVSEDWMRYAHNAYLLWTSRACKEISIAVLRTPGLQDSSILATVIDINGEANAILPNWAWEWIGKYMPGGENPTPVAKLLEQPS